MREEQLQRPIRKEEAALMIGKSVRSLEREMKNRQIKYYKVGKNVWFTLKDIEDYLGGCSVEPRS